MMNNENFLLNRDYGFSSYFYTESGISAFGRPYSSERMALAYCTRGRFEMKQNGEKYTFGEGDLAVCNCGSQCDFRSLEKSTGMILISFEPDMLLSGFAGAAEYKFILPFLGEGTKHQKIFSSGEIERTSVPDSIRKIHGECIGQKYGFELLVKSEICCIFLWILRYWNRLGINVEPVFLKPKNVAEKFDVVFEYINKNYTENITAADMAKLCGMSYCYFSRSFKAVTKKGFTEYLNSVRISHAARLLASTEKNITDIAYSCGFSTSSYFIQQFKKHKGISPMMYRQKS